MGELIIIVNDEMYEKHRVTHNYDVIDWLWFIDFVFMKSFEGQHQYICEIWQTAILPLALTTAVACLKSDFNDSMMIIKKQNQLGLV